MLQPTIGFANDRAAYNVFSTNDMPVDAILIAEDDPIHRTFIRDTISESALEPVLLYEAGDGEAAIEIATRHHVLYIVLDLQMPRLSGVDAARRIWVQEPRTRILFWSNFADEAYVRSLARIVPVETSYGYLLKSSSPERLKSAIEGVFADGQCIVDREIRGIQVRTEQRVDALTNLEYDMLIDISLGFTDQAIAARHGLSTRGVQSRLQKLYSKLNTGQFDPLDRGRSTPVFNPRTRAIYLAIMRGLLNSDIFKRVSATDPQD